MFLQVCVCQWGRGVSQHALQVVSQHALQQVSRGCGIPACLAGFQAHSQGGSLGGSGPGPQPRGKLRGIWPGGCLLGVMWRSPLMATAAGGTHPTGMHSCLLSFSRRCRTIGEPEESFTHRRHSAPARNLPGFEIQDTLHQKSNRWASLATQKIPMSSKKIKKSCSLTRHTAGYQHPSFLCNLTYLQLPLVAEQIQPAASPWQRNNVLRSPYCTVLSLRS